MSEATRLLSQINEGYRKMAAFAEALDWDRLVNEWQNTHPDLTRLRQIPFEHLPAQEREQAAKQIAELLKLEQSISARALPWMEQVRPLLDVFQQYPLG